MRGLAERSEVVPSSSEESGQPGLANRMASRREGLGGLGLANKVEGFGWLGQADRCEGVGLRQAKPSLSKTEASGLVVHSCVLQEECLTCA